MIGFDNFWFHIDGPKVEGEQLFAKICWWWEMTLVNTIINTMINIVNTRHSLAVMNNPMSSNSLRSHILPIWISLNARFSRRIILGNLKKGVDAAVFGEVSPIEYFVRWKLYKFFINAAYLLLPLKDDTKKMHPLDFIDLEK